MADVNIDIVAKLEGIEASIKGLESIGKAAQDSLGKLVVGAEKAAEQTKILGSNVTKAAIGFLALNEGIALVQKLASVLSSPIHAAIESENAVNELNESLRESGKFTQEVSRDFQEFAKALQNQSKFTSAAILSSTGLLATLTNLDEQGLKKATETAVDLAAALGVSLDVATKKVVDALQGGTVALKGKTIALQKGATAAETATLALQQLGDLVGGRALAQTKTFGGALNQLTKSFEEIIEEFGKALTTTEGFQSGIEAVGHTFEEFAGFIKANAEAIRVSFRIATEAATAFLIVLAGIQATAFIRAAGGIVLALQGMVAGFTSARISALALQATLTLGLVALIETGLQFKALTERLGGFGPALKATGIGARQIFEEINAAVLNFSKVILNTFAKIPGLGPVLKNALGAIDDALLESDKNTLKLSRSLDDLERASPRGPANAIADIGAGAGKAAKAIDGNLIKSIEDLEKKFKDAGKTQIEIIQDNADDAIRAIEKVAAEEPRLKDRAQRLIEKIVLESERKIQDEKDKLQKEQRDRELKEIERAKDRAKALASGAIEEIITEIKIKPVLDKEDFSNLGTSFIKSVEKGADGAKDAVAGIIGAAAQLSSVFGPFGKLIGEFAKFLAEGPEKVKKLLTEFEKGGIQTVKNIVDGFFSFLSTALANLPENISATLGGQTSQFIQQILGQAIPNLVIQALQVIPQAMIVALDSIGPLVDAIAAGLLTLLDRLASELPNILQGLAAKIPELATKFELVAIAFGTKLIENVVPISIAFTKALVANAPTIAITFTQELIKQTPTIIDAIKVGVVNAFTTAGEALVNGVKDGIKDIFKNIPALNGGIGGQQFKFPGFASGGEIPSGFPNDSFMARLSSKENVINPGLSEELSEFVETQNQFNSQLLGAIAQGSGGGGGGTAVVNVQVSDRQLASILLDMDRRGLRTRVG